MSDMLYSSLCHALLTAVCEACHVLISGDGATAFHRSRLTCDCLSCCESGINRMIKPGVDRLSASRRKSKISVATQARGSPVSLIVHVAIEGPILALIYVLLWNMGFVGRLKPQHSSNPPRVIRTYVSCDAEVRCYYSTSSPSLHGGKLDDE
jgi:hypothetical protein